MGWYYAFQSIFFFDRTSSLLVLMSAMFTVAWIERHNEMTALMAAGVLRVRIVAPVILAGTVITCLATLNREMLIPRYKEQLAQRPGDLVGNIAQEISLQRDYETDVLINGLAAYPDSGRIEQPEFLLPRTFDEHEYGHRISAENAYYQPPAGKHPGGYLFDGVREPKNLAKKASVSLGQRPVLITPRDAPDWLGPQQCFVASDVTLEQLTGDRAFRMFASTADMIRALRNRAMDYGADIHVTIHSRIVQPVLDVALLLLGLPLVVSRESRNVFMAIGLCIGVVAFFLSTVIAFQQLGGGGAISPSLAAWSPVIIFVPAAVGAAGTMWEK